MSSYQKLKRNQKTKDDAKVKARNNFVQLKANEISEHIKMDKLDVDIQEMILQKIADNHDFMLINEEALVLTAVQCMVVRNYVQTSTNGMYRLKQVLEVFCPQLKGKLLPADLRRILQELEQTGVVPAIACQIELETAQDKKKRQSLCTTMSPNQAKFSSFRLQDPSSMDHTETVLKSAARATS